MTKNIFFLLAFIFALSSCTSEPAQSPNQAEDYQIIPKPVSLEMQAGHFQFAKDTKLSGTTDLVNEGKYLADLLSTACGKKITFSTEVEGNIRLSLDASLPSNESYVLSVSEEEILIAGKSPAGVFYGIQSLRQLLPTQKRAAYADQGLRIPACKIEDTPRFAYRGMHLDVARHFFPTSFVKKYIDYLAMHKMNTFHWHLTEDQGWRIEIKKYPKLTEIGAWRNGTIVGHFPGTKNDNERYGGFYTQEEIKEIVAYAAARHITIIPEIEMPGHSSAAIAAYPELSSFPEELTEVPEGMMSEGSKAAQASGQVKLVQESWGVYNDVYCAGKEETFTFLEDVLSEVMELFPSEYIHIGGDECPKGNWERSPLCQKRMQEEGLADAHELQSYFIKRIEKFVNSKGKNIIGWDEILEGGIAPNATIMSWRGNAGGISAARADHKVIMSPNSHCYFDHYQSEKTEEEPMAIGGFTSVAKVYDFDPVPAELEESKHKYILGGQANLWTEYITTAAYAEYMLFPRMTALSEVLWTSKANKNWDDFKGRLEHFRQRYDAMGVNYAKHVFAE